MSVHRGVVMDTEMGGVACAECGWHLSGRFADDDEQGRMHDESYPEETTP